ncbi:hypothetical protein BDY21DRAFT_44244 [Lineolata rhizophorae]|uniref:Transcription elongation factor 1 homolog n=1 Tax=Lineolata rhizophorae TaxID=578093 RepID=A0A6A6NZ87_9PEZI|nr:hypothetical protein BDY21DRAFT_44244 [Lineolata rhizophorae]
MGKRKKSSRKPAPKKRREALDTTFTCLFCNHEKAVTVKMEKKAGVANLSCKICGQTFQSGINWLSAPIDVYSDWIDACEAAQNGEPVPPGPGVAEDTYRGTAAPPKSPGAPEGRVAKEMNDFIEDDEDAEGEYNDE